MEEKISRLSPYNIKDALLRARLYEEIRDRQVGDYEDDWALYEVQPADALTPEFVAYKVYQDDKLKWVVLIAAHLDDMRERLDVGVILKLPPTYWLRQRIRYYSDKEA